MLETKKINKYLFNKMQIKTIILFCGFCILSSSCSILSPESEELLPEGVVERERMIVILADMQVAEAHLLKMKKRRGKVKDSSMVYFRKVFKKNEITEDTFEKSLKYYQQDLKNMKSMYADVVTRLNELQAKHDEILLEMKADSVRQDSIKKVIIIKDSLDKILADSLLLVNDTSIQIIDTSRITN